MLNERSYTLNDKEQAVYNTFPAPPKKDEKVEDKHKIHIEDIARDAFAKKGTSPKTKGNSWVRNSLRKLQRLELVKHVDGGKSGTYVRTLVTPTEVLSEFKKAKAAKEAKAVKVAKPAKARAVKKAA